jgi:hypothetical protein
MALSTQGSLSDFILCHLDRWQNGQRQACLSLNHDNYCFIHSGDVQGELDKNILSGQIK